MREMATRIELDETGRATMVRKPLGSDPRHGRVVAGVEYGKAPTEGVDVGAVVGVECSLQHAMRHIRAKFQQLLRELQRRQVRIALEKHG